MNLTRSILEFISELSGLKPHDIVDKYVIFKTNDLNHFEKIDVQSQILEMILNTVALKWGVNSEDLRSRRKDLESVLPRYQYYSFARQITKASLRQIGNVVNLDHSTVQAGLKQHEDEVNTNIAYRITLKNIQEVFDNAGIEFEKVL